MISEKYISVLINDKLPQFIRQEYPKFVKFITDYYTWAEQKGNPYHFLTNFLSYHDIDETEIEFVDYFLKTFMSTFPVDVKVDKRFLVKHIREHYRAKGTEKSIKFIFKIVFDEDIDFYYPYYDILNVSDGKWLEKTSLKVTSESSIDDSINGCELVGTNSGARGIIESITRYTSSDGTLVTDIQIAGFDYVHPISDFIIGELVTSTNFEETISLSETVLSVCSGITVSSLGRYYKRYDPIFLSSIVGVGALFYVDNVSKGKIDSIVIIDGGAGYTINDKVTITVGDSLDKGTGAKALISSVGVAGDITGITLISGGYGFTDIPKISIFSALGLGEGAVLVTESSSIGNVKSVLLGDSGVNYSENINDTDVLFSSIIQLHSVVGIFRVGEIVTGSISGATAIINRHNQINNIVNVDTVVGVFGINDIITGADSGTVGTFHGIFTSSGTVLVDSISTLPGYYINNDGHLSDTKYIQDSYFYQKYSYLITTHKAREEYKQLIYSTCHPAGTILFGYNEIGSTEIETAYCGFSSPLLESLEIYKFTEFSNEYCLTSISLYADYMIEQFTDDILEIDTICPGSELTINIDGIEIIFGMQEDGTLWLQEDGTQINQEG